MVYFLLNFVHFAVSPMDLISKHTFLALPGFINPYRTNVENRVSS